MLSAGSAVEFARGPSRLAGRVALAGMDPANVDDGRRISFKHRRSPVGFITFDKFAQRFRPLAVKSLVVPR
jgi:hypothetical protein